jgi:transcription termination/antitermination protein NusG
MEYEPFEERPDATTDAVDPTDVDTRDQAETPPPAAQPEASDVTEEAGPEAPEADEDSAADLAAEALLLDEAAGELANEAIAREVLAADLAAEAMTAGSVADELANEAEQAQAAGDDERAAELATEAESAAEASDELAAEAVLAEASAEELDTDAVVAETAAAEAADEALDLAAVEDAAPAQAEDAAAAEAEDPEPDEAQETAGGSNGAVVVVEAEAAEETEAEDAELGDGSRLRSPGDWYVVHTYSGYENKVKANLGQRIASMQMEDKIFEVVIPMEDVMEIKGGKKQVVQRKVFPGYLLVRMVYDNDSWYVVRNTPGVTGFVSSGTGTKPTPLSTREVQKILAVKEDTQKKPEYRLEWEEGDVVRIVAGPFADFTGTISEINVEQSKLRVMVNIFDRETPVELAFDQVAKA